MTDQTPVESEARPDDKFFFMGKFRDVRRGTPEDGPELDGCWLVIIDKATKPIPLNELSRR